MTLEQSDAQLDLIDQRVARFAASLRATDLWPDVGAAELQSARRCIERTVRNTLHDRPAAALEETRAHSARALSIAAFFTGVGPLLGHWISTGRIAASHDV